MSERREWVVVVKEGRALVCLRLSNSVHVEAFMNADEDVDVQFVLAEDVEEAAILGELKSKGRAVSDEPALC